MGLSLLLIGLSFHGIPTFNDFSGMIFRSLMLFLLASMLHVSGAAKDFIGTWEIQADAQSEGTEIKYPVRMTITQEHNHLKGTYTDQYGYRGQFSLIVTINEDRDLLLVMAYGTEEDSSYSPIHHAKFLNGVLRGICLTTTKRFEWKGVRK